MPAAPFATRPAVGRQGAVLSLLVRAVLVGAFLVLLQGPLGAVAEVPRRGLYVSMDDTYEDWEYSNLISNLRRQAILFDYCRRHGVNALSLYDLYIILPQRSDEMRDFIRRARREAGIRWIEAIAQKHWAWANVAEYQAATTDHDERFDGAVSEIEYWAHGGTNVTEMLDPIAFTKRLDPPPRLDPISPDASRFYYASYIGWPQAGQIKNEMAAELDFVYVHAFRREPCTSYVYSKKRLDELDEAAGLVAVTIFSSEGERYRAMEERFMGDWLGAHENHTMQAAEYVFRKEYAKDHGGVFPPARHWGAQWFLYIFSQKYDNDTSSRGPWLPAPDHATSWKLLRMGTEFHFAAWCPHVATGDPHVCRDPLARLERKHDAVVLSTEVDYHMRVAASLKLRNRTHNGATATLPNRTIVCTLSLANWSAAAIADPLGAAAAGARSALSVALARASDHGCDAVLYTHADCWIRDECHSAEPEGTRRAQQLEANKLVALEAHKLGLAAGIAGDEWQWGSLADDFDFAVSEDCDQCSGLCAAASAFLDRDKAVIRLDNAPFTAESCTPTAEVTLSHYLSVMRGSTNGEWYDCKAGDVPGTVRQTAAPCRNVSVDPNWEHVLSCDAPPIPPPSTLAPDSLAGGAAGLGAAAPEEATSYVWAAMVLAAAMVVLAGCLCFMAILLVRLRREEEDERRRIREHEQRKGTGGAAVDVTGAADPLLTVPSSSAATTTTTKPATSTNPLGPAPKGSAAVPVPAAGPAAPTTVKKRPVPAAQGPKRAAGTKPVAKSAASAEGSGNLAAAAPAKAPGKKLPATSAGPATPAKAKGAPAKSAAGKRKGPPPPAPSSAEPSPPPPIDEDDL